MGVWMNELIETIEAFAIKFIVDHAPSVMKFPALVADRIAAYWLFFAMLALAVVLLIAIGTFCRSWSQVGWYAGLTLAVLAPPFAYLTRDALFIHQDKWQFGNQVFHNDYSHLVLTCAAALFGMALYLAVSLAMTRIRSSSIWRYTAVVGAILAVTLAARLLFVLVPTSGVLERTIAQGTGTDVLTGERSEAKDEKKADAVTVYFGTDRRKSLTAGQWSLTNARGKELTLGAATVTIPENHKRGVLKLPSEYTILGLTIYKEQQDPSKHFVLRSLELHTRDGFLAKLRQHPDRNSAFVFIHGFNVLFDAAIYRTAQIAYDLQFQGVPFLYSWPSAGGIKSYVADLSTSQGSEPHLKSFLELVLRESEARNVYVIAHSMGNMPFLRVINSLNSILKDDEKARVRQIVLAAPDVDEDVFENLATAMAGFGGATLYASSGDRAIAGSTLISAKDDTRRVGGVSHLGPVVVT